MMETEKHLTLEEWGQRTFSEEFLQYAEIEYNLAQIAGRVFRAKEDSGQTFKNIAEKMGLESPARLLKVIQEAEPHDITVADLVRFAQACGCTLDVNFVKKEK